jgi:amino acid transporter
MQAVGQALLLTGVFAALLSFHSVVARYIYSLARETVLPASLGTLGGRQGGVPVAGSVAQTSTVAAGIAVIAVSGADPLTTLAWGAELCALGILVLMICTSLAVIRYYRVQGRPLRFKLGVVPLCSVIALTSVLVVSIANMDSITGAESGATMRWVLPGIVLLVAAGGGLLALRIRKTNPIVYSAIGHGGPRPLAVPERALADLEM